MWRKREKLDFLASGSAAWETITPDPRHSWIIPRNANEFGALIPIGDLFAIQSRGLMTARDEVTYDWDQQRLASRMQSFIEAYNTEARRHKSDQTADWPDHIKWSETLKIVALRGLTFVFDRTKIVRSLYRPFTRKFLYFERFVNERVYQWPNISGRVIAVPGIGNRKEFGTFISDMILPVDFAFEKVQCFPLSHLNDSASTTPTTPSRKKTSFTTFTPSCIIRLSGAVRGKSEARAPAHSSRA